MMLRLSFFLILSHIVTLCDAQIVVVRRNRLGEILGTIFGLVFLLLLISTIVAMRRRRAAAMLNPNSGGSGGVLLIRRRGGGATRRRNTFFFMHRGRHAPAQEESPREPRTGSEAERGVVDGVSQPNGNAAAVQESDKKGSVDDSAFPPPAEADPNIIQEVPIDKA